MIKMGFFDKIDNVSGSNIIKRSSIEEAVKCLHLGGGSPRLSSALRHQHTQICSCWLDKTFNCRLNDVKLLTQYMQHRRWLSWKMTWSGSCDSDLCSGSSSGCCLGRLPVQWTPESLEPSQAGSKKYGLARRWVSEMQGLLIIDSSCTLQSAVFRCDSHIRPYRTLARLTCLARTAIWPMIYTRTESLHLPLFHLLLLFRCWQRLQKNLGSANEIMSPQVLYPNVNTNSWHQTILSK